jgi:nucleotide-binding universal stress UspA family protein
MNTIFFRKIVWAVDVLRDLDAQESALMTANAIATATGAEIRPVFVLGTPYSELAADAARELEKEFRELAQSRLDQYCHRHQIPRFTRAQVLVSRNSSLRKQVRTLVDYLEREKADLLVLSTRARGGLERFFMGSFAETLALSAHVPFIAVNPETSAPISISKILHPTSFEERSRSGFERVVELAKITEASLSLFYKEPHIDGELRTPQLERYLTEEAAKRMGTAEEWRAYAMNFGVKTEIILDNKPGDLTQAITQQAAGNGFDLIALTTSVDGFFVPVLGTLARKLMRESTVPVWNLNIEDGD